MINLNEGFSVPRKTPKFKAGQIVTHLKYSYRGLVVESDETCQADEIWYQSNQTQPDREQPWYHLLVDGNQHVTYVAETNLEPDLSGNPIVHPMLNLFFYGIDEENNRYLRTIFHLTLDYHQMPYHLHHQTNHHRYLPTLHKKLIYSNLF